MPLVDEDSLDVPEEPANDDDSILEQVQKKDADPELQSQASSVMSFTTAVRIARWMARAYGYVARKRKAYLHQQPAEYNISRETSKVDLLNDDSKQRLSRKSSRVFLECESPRIEQDQINTEGLKSSLVGEENQDRKTICQWFATSYGETNHEYHEAYSREILRQMRQQLNMETDPVTGAQVKKTTPSWF